MRCPRCQGLLAPDYPLSDLVACTVSGSGDGARRCLNCGHVEDAVILRHQERRRQDTLTYEEVHDALYHQDC